MTNQASEDELQKWWWFCNGTGTDACSKCRNSMMCSWHSARLDELSELIRTEKLKLLAAAKKRVIPNPTTPAGDNEFLPLYELTKMEAEL